MAGMAGMAAGPPHPGGATAPTAVLTGTAPTGTVLTGTALRGTAPIGSVPPGPGPTSTATRPSTIGAPAGNNWRPAPTPLELEFRDADRLAAARLRDAKVLVVDDDFRNIFAMTALLERGHAEVSVAESGRDALAVLTLKPDIDIVLMDIMMPIMDGYDTIRAIRALPQFSGLPIVAVTGKVMPGERQRCIEAGANDFVPKPVDTAELLAVLGPWLPAITGAPA
jgi:CheY-like chemotaxis protein